ncbi:MAG: CHAT domain-containing protein, partial [Prevotellaceae bacterium]|nr:CHAT domain-containing protein [Candidatus Faecinaster equi]
MRRLSNYIFAFLLFTSLTVSCAGKESDQIYDVSQHINEDWSNLPQYYDQICECISKADFIEQQNICIWLDIAPISTMPSHIVQNEYNSIYQKLIYRIADQCSWVQQMKMGRDYITHNWCFGDELFYHNLAATLVMVQTVYAGYNSVGLGRIMNRYMYYIEHQLWGDALFMRDSIQYVLPDTILHHLENKYNFDISQNIWSGTNSLIQQVWNGGRLTDEDVYAVLYWGLFACSDDELYRIQLTLSSKYDNNTKVMEIYTQILQDLLGEQYNTELADFIQSVSTTEISMNPFETLQQYVQHLQDEGIIFSLKMPSEMTEEELSNENYSTYEDLLAPCFYAFIKEIYQRGISAQNIHAIASAIRPLYTTLDDKPDDIVIQLFLDEVSYIFNNQWEIPIKAWLVDAIDMLGQLQMMFMNTTHYSSVSILSTLQTCVSMGNATGNVEYIKNLMNNYFIPCLFDCQKFKKLDGYSQTIIANSDAWTLYTYASNNIPCPHEWTEKLEKDALKRLKKCDNPYYATDVLVCYYEYVKEWKKMRKMIHILEEYADDSTLISRVYRLKANYALDVKQYEKCIAYLDLADSIQECDKQTHLSFMMTRLIAYAYLNKKEECCKLLAILSSELRNEILNEIFIVGDVGGYSENLNQDLLTIIHPEDEFPINLRYEFNKFHYNWELIQKGLQLQVHSKAEELLLHHPSKTVRESYAQVRQLTEEMSNQSVENGSSTNYQWKEYRLNILKRKLQTTLREYYDQNLYTENFFITWDAIREALSHDAIAIEFVMYDSKDSIPQYEALLLRHVWKAPIRIDLHEIDNSLWSRLAPYFQGVNTIYFSPSGHLHQLPLESLPYDSISVMSDHFNMVRLSSTRELVLAKQPTQYESATVYGGIQYNVSTDDLLAQSRQYDENSLLAHRGIANDTINRGSVQYLPGTKIEAEAIVRMLQGNRIPSKLYTASAANEESFKALNGQKQNILHIGTHGFCWPDSTAQQQKYFTQRMSMQLMGDAQPRTTFIDPLDRCGILFAGANMALSGHSKELPEGVQDGILTAKEISLMDLSGCDLVVLSACETAKGDITSEGVFGLQRAFKMAGVQTIIMSLWPVDDKATQMLMTEFYTNWINHHQPKREAFKNA